MSKVDSKITIIVIVVLTIVADGSRRTSDALNSDQYDETNAKWMRRHHPLACPDSTEM